MGLRQRAKEKRRKLVLIAARGLIVDQGVAGLNMRALAEAAELSVATLYNHFGSKEELLQALLDQSFDTLNAASVEVKAADAIARAQEVVRMACGQFTADADFYRQLLRGLQSAEQGARPSSAVLRIWALAETVVADAVAEKAINPSINQRLIAQQILSTYSSALRLWTIGRIDDRVFEAQAMLGVDLALMAYATPAAHKKLTAHAQKLEPIIFAGNPIFATTFNQTTDDGDGSRSSAA